VGFTNPPKLPPVFQFSQNSLQDYRDCARRFQLRYVLGQQWPAVEAEPLRDHEYFLDLGEQFHLLAQRYFLGIPPERLTPHDPLLGEWWQNFLQYPVLDLPTTLRKPEFQLSTPLANQRLLARFDLLAIEPGQRAVIVDWKTSRYRPDRRTLASRLQTRVYPFVLAEAGTYLFGCPISPEQIRLVYWFASDPTRPEIFEYDASLHKENRDYLAQLINEIMGQEEEIWPLTGDTTHCEYCIYRSLCDRGAKAGLLDSAPVEITSAESDFRFELDEVEEIAF